jgi:hypothetical protein
MSLRWRYGIIAGIFLAVFSLYPQFKMLYLRGDDWNGHYAYNDIDEVSYASYLKALIDGRPRKNDPYTGRDDTAGNPQPESLFSIQFAGPYTIAIPARMLGIGAPWAMTISGALAAFLTALAIFWLIGMITEDSLFAMAGTLVVLAGGALFAGEGAIGEITGWSYSYPYFPGFRRYVPAMAFPAFFVMIALVWKLLAGSQRSSLLSALAVLAFGYTVFSYFYVWTTAAAWLGCLVLVVAAGRVIGYGRDLKWLMGIAVGCGMLLIPYAMMLSNRSHTMDDVQMLINTHAPDLLRPPELVSYFVLVLLAAAVLTRTIVLRDRSTLFAISLALVPIAVFNQQVITGRSLQPIHYQVFIGNYVAGLAFVIAIGLLWRQIAADWGAQAKAATVALATVAAAWGFVECHFTVRVLDDVNVLRDEAYPVGSRLTEIDSGDANARLKNVLYFGIAEADDLPTIAPQSLLWARHQHIFAGVTWQENKERYYQQLYYQSVNGRYLAESIKRGEDFVSMIALFGWGRHTDRLNSEYKPLTFGEIDAEAGEFDAYVERFDPSTAVELSYLVMRADDDINLGNVDLWYIRDQGELVGNYILYRLTKRSRS